MGYSNLSYLDVEQRRFRVAERVLEDSLAYSVERDIPICNHWQTGGAVPAPVPGGAVAGGPGGRRRRVGPLGHAAGPGLAAPGQRTGALRRGGGVEHLEAAWDLAERLDEPLRRLPSWLRWPSGCG